METPRKMYYHNWKGLRKEDRKTVISAQKKKCRKSSQIARKKDVSDTKRQLSELSSNLTETKDRIITFSGKPQGTSSSEDNSGQEAPVPEDSGNSFGGRASKRTMDWLASSPDLGLFCLMMFIKFYLLTRLGGYKPARARIIKTSQIDQVVSSVWRNMGPTICLSSDHSVHNIDNAYRGRVELELHSDTTNLGRNYVILTYTGRECKVSPYSDEY